MTNQQTALVDRWETVEEIAAARDHLQTVNTDSWPDVPWRQVGET